MSQMPNQSGAEPYTSTPQPDETAEQAAATSPTPPPVDTGDDLQAEIRRIVAAGGDVRQQVRDAVQRAVNAAQTRAATGEPTAPQPGFLDITQQAMQGAIAGLQDQPRSDPQEKDNRLHQVIGGLQEGFTAGAEAARLAVEESAGRAESFGREDLAAVAEEFKELRDKFVDTISHALGVTKQELTEQAQNYRQHAQRAVEAMRPAVQRTAQAAGEEPGKLASDTGQSVRQRAGSLLATVGGMIQAAGDLLMQEPQQKQAGDEAATPPTPKPEERQQGSAGPQAEKTTTRGPSSSQNREDPMPDDA